jgi:DNA-binding MarR family transcriptional regulator
MRRGWNAARPKVGCLTGWPTNATQIRRARTPGLLSITIPQFRALVILSARGPMNVRTLAGLLHVQRSTTGRMVERLITAGLIDRRPHPALRRELVVELTRRGEEIVHAVTAHRREEIARVVRNMPERERYGLVSALTAFTTAGGEPPARLEIDGYLV